MAPMTRSTTTIPHPDPLSSNSREGGWHFLESGEMASEREISEEPASLYDEAEIISGLDEDEDYDRPALESPEDHEDILHPLREAANRVGSEVENFAKALDEFNPLRATSAEDKHDMTVALIKKYSSHAQHTLQRLREQHISERKKQDGLRWRKTFRGFKIAQDEDEMELEDPEDNHLPDPKTTLQDLERWEEESQTWDLLQRLVEIRFPGPEGESIVKTSTSHHARIHQYSTEREVWKGFLESDGLALERKTVLQWLKHTAEESGEDIDVLVEDLQKNAERGDIIAHGWLHTKAAVKNQKRIHAWSHPMDPASPEVQRVHWNSTQTEPLVTHLDPDTVTRQGRKLEAQDEYFERAIWLGCYEMLRRGKSLTEIREWCTERTEVWRAVSMSGLPDEKLENEDQVENPASSALWRRMCFALARKGGGDEYERAVYGILSGDISSVEPVCRSWDDFVFTHYNALLRTQFDKYLQLHYPERMSVNNSTFGIFDAVQFHGDSETAGRKLIETLKTDRRTASETSRPMKMIQGVLISNQFTHFIYQQGLALSKFANASGPSNLFPVTAEQPENEHINKYIAIDDHDSLRVLTHILLALVSLGVDMGGPSKQAVIENIIVSYISFLRLAGKEELIPLYCSQLSGNRRYATLCRSLIDVTDPEQRNTQIKLMRELGLDVQEFVKYQSRYLFADYPDNAQGYPAMGNFHLLEDVPAGKQGQRVRRDFFGEDPDKLDRVDMLLIRSLEWYLLIDGLWSETFYFGTMLYLRFFKHMHLSAARMLASRVSSSDISKKKTRAILGRHLDFHELEHGSDDEDLTEVLDWSSDAHRLLRKHLLAEAKSFRELETLIESLDNMETIASMGELLHEQSERNWQKGWRQQLARAVTPTKLSVQPLLRKWLLTSQREEQLIQFQHLREAYLPETILAYIKTLHFAGSVLSRDLLMECMDLSALVAAQESDLLDLFIKTGRMQELVEAFALAGKELLILTSQKQGSGSKSKKLRAMGWTPELWSVKP